MIVTLGLLLGVACTAIESSNPESNISGGTVNDVAASTGVGGIGGQGQATSTPGVSGSANSIWRTTSIGVQVTHSWGISYCPGNPSNCPSNWTCNAIARNKMSKQQLDMLDALAVVKGVACYLCDGWNDYHLLVLDQDGSVTTYAGPNCNCLGSVADVMISQEFFNSFPLDGAETCPG